MLIQSRVWHAGNSLELTVVLRLNVLHLRALLAVVIVEGCAFQSQLQLATFISGSLCSQYALSIISLLVTWLTVLKRLIVRIYFHCSVISRISAINQLLALLVVFVLIQRLLDLRNWLVIYGIVISFLFSHDLFLLDISLTLLLNLLWINRLLLLLIIPIRWFVLSLLCVIPINATVLFQVPRYNPRTHQLRRVNNGLVLLVVNLVCKRF